MSDDNRDLPTWIDVRLSKRDIQLNKLPVSELLELFKARKIKVFVDRGLALQAAASGVPTSGLAVLLSFLFPALILSAPIVWFFYSWVHALIAMVLAVLSYRTSRAFVVSNVGKQALNNPKLLDMLISKGTIWFEHAP